MTESYFPPATAAGVRDFRVLGPSMPVRLEIPAIGVSTAVVPIGLRADGALDVGPSPDGAPAVFFRLRLLRPGDRIAVRRADHGVARFAVVGIGIYPTGALPGDQAYGPSDQPTLTLLTVGGVPDRSLVVSARLLPQD